MKRYQFLLESGAKSDFEALPHLLQQRIFSKLRFFERSKSPLSFAKKLYGYENIYRFRIGDYRLIVTPKDKGVLVILLILKIGHRRDVYE